MPHNKEADIKELLADKELSRFANRLLQVRKECLVGVPANGLIRRPYSYCGGFPAVDDDFVWPIKNGHPLHFVASLDSAGLRLAGFQQGNILLFYDDRHWGIDPKDRGHAVAIWQEGRTVLHEDSLPSVESRYFFGLLRRTAKPTVFSKVPISFQKGYSYPHPDRGMIDFSDDIAVEAYLNFLTSRGQRIQIGGFPNPVQSDWMEAEAAAAIGMGEREDWRLLLQLPEVGNMAWGDAGTLYWFIHRDDLENGRLDRVWMVTQCH